MVFELIAAPDYIFGTVNAVCEIKKGGIYEY